MIFELSMCVLCHAFAGIYEWEAALNVSTGKVYYVNNVNYTNVSNIGSWSVENTRILGLRKTCHTDGCRLSYRSPNFHGHVG